jgi:hypothetical protein
MSPTKTVVQSLEQSIIPTTISPSSSNQTFGLSISPPAYDQTSASSYVCGSKVEVNGFIYMCNSYPYEIYCTIPSFQPQSENKLWVDAWVEVEPCKIDESSTIKPSLKPSSVSSTSSKSESWTTHSSASIQSHSTNVPTYFPTSSPSQNATKNFPTISPTSKQPTNANTKAPTYSPITSAAFNIQSSYKNGSDTQKSAAPILLKQSTTNSVQDGKNVLWASLAISVAVVFCVAAVLHRNRRFPEPKICLNFTDAEETFHELPSGCDSGSMSVQIDFLPDAEPKRQPDAFNQNPRFQLLPPSLISLARLKEPVPSQCVASPTSMICFPESRSNEKRDVIAPPGKLGIILKQSLFGCMIQSVKPESPMLGILFPDDLILSFNNMVCKEGFSHPLHHTTCPHTQRMLIIFLYRMSWSLMHVN